MIPAGFWGYFWVMALVTYLIRMLPLTLFQKKIQSRFVRSFLFYVPYAVLSAMTVPAIFSATASVWSAAAGVAVAVFFAFAEKGLLIVAMAACGSVWIVEYLLRML
ncbi:MAG: AzlD domain-containing protein [Angelakisella sp.]|nr:AzlD domain-containing protein [Angelakisella sp.]